MVRGFNNAYAAHDPDMEITHQIQIVQVLSRTATTPNLNSRWTLANAKLDIPNDKEGDPWHV